MLNIENLRSDDLPVTAALHREQLRLGLFPKMGRKFLCRYQETFAESPHGIALVARSEAGIVGTLFGTTSNADHYRWVVRNRGWVLAARGGIALMVRPRLAWNFATTRFTRYANGIARHAGPAEPASAPDVKGPVSVLSHIITSPSQHRRGIGRRLVEEFRLLARSKGSRRAVLVTEEGGMGAAFFEHIGCECITCRQGHDGSSLREYRLPLDIGEMHETIGHRRRRRDVDRTYQRSAA